MGRNSGREKWEWGQGGNEGTFYTDKTASGKIIKRNLNKKKYILNDKEKQNYIILIQNLLMQK